MKAFNIIVITVFVGTVGFIVYSIVKDSDRKYFSTVKAETSTIEEKLYLSGFIHPSKEIEIKPQISGVVDVVYVNIGDLVKEGDQIASISLVPNSSEVEQLRNNVNIAQINLSATQKTYERQKQLLDKKAIAKAEFETIEKDYLTAKENYSTALKQLNLRQEDRNAAKNIVKSSTSGTIIDIPVTVGSSIVERSYYNAGSTIATIAGTDHYIFKADVPEKNIGRLNIGMTVKLSLLAFENMKIEATITKISAKGDMRGGSVKFSVEAEFTLSDGRTMDLRSGYSAIGEIVLSRVYDVITLHEKYIKFKGDTAFVYVIDSLKNKAKEKIVTLGISDGEIVQIKKGISAGDLIITNYND